MKCIKCGCYTKVSETMKINTAVYRKRVCNNCNNIFNTKEEVTTDKFSREMRTVNGHYV